MKFNFHNFRKPRLQRLFIPLNSFSFASFVVPIKFHQPVPIRVVASRHSAWSFSRSRARLDGPRN
jgi:hypothetical protein